MSKLGYTFYPKDWQTSDAVFDLTLSERGAYRELIDTYMLNNGNVDININVWVRKWNSSTDEINSILNRLKELKLIIIESNKLIINSCDNRLLMVNKNRENGKKGGRPKTQTETQTQTQTKPNSIGKEKEKEKDKEKVIPIDEQKLISQFNLIFGKKSKVLGTKAKKQLQARLKEGYTKEDILLAMHNASKDQHHIDSNFKYITLEFMSRQDKLDRFVNMNQFYIKTKII